MSIKHTTIATGTNDGTKQVSVTVWNEAHAIDIGLNLPDNAYPSIPGSPVSGSEVFAQVLMSTWRTLGYIDQDGSLEYLCPHPLRANVYKLVPAGGSSNTTFAQPMNHIITATGNTFSTQSPAAGSEILLSVRYRASTNATAGNAVDIRPQATMANRDGGFAFSTTFRLVTTSTANFSFFGMFAATNAMGATTNPTTNTTTARIGLAIPNNSGNWDLVHIAAGTAPTVTDLGANFPVDTTTWYRFSLYCDDADTATVYYVVENLTTSSTTNGTITTNLPLAATLMGARQYHSNNSNGVAVSFESTGYYLQTRTV